MYDHKNRVILGGVKMAKTANEKRTEVVNKLMSRKRKNIYDKENKRLMVGSGFGDCSSTVAWAYKEAIGMEIGGYTPAQYSNKKGYFVDVDNGSGIPDVTKLKPGDLIFFKGKEVSDRKQYDYVGHVEMYIGNNNIMGHGSGIGSTIKDINVYCKSRKGSKQYLKTKRFILDDDSEEDTDNSPPPTPPSEPEKKPDKKPEKDSLDLAIKDKGNRVQKLQQDLKKLGYDPKGIDGIFGKDTEAAVKRFQKDMSLVSDGIVGPKTRAKIKEKLLKLSKYTIVKEGAILKCPFGTTTCKLIVSGKENLKTQNGKEASIMDCKAGSNIKGFGTCKAKQPDGSCKPAVLFHWIYGNENYLVNGEPALMSNSILGCLFGGVIEIADNGQNKKPVTKEEKKKTKITMSNKILVYGSRGKDVTELQKYLKKLGYDPKGIDGIYGPDTRKAVRDFQKAYGLLVDGKAGPETKGKMLELLNGKDKDKNQDNKEDEKEEQNEDGYPKIGKYINLGYLCGYFESRNDPSIISTGKGDSGGKSYGAFQFSSKYHIPKNFADWMEDKNKDFSKALIDAYSKDKGSYGTNFDTTWKSIADLNKEEFLTLQYGFSEEMYYMDSMNKLKGVYDFDVAGFTLKNVLFSRSIQHGVGGCMNVIKRAFGNLGKGSSKEEIIDAIYKESGATENGKNGYKIAESQAKAYGVYGKTMKYFGGNGSSTQWGVWKRLNINELQKAKELLKNYD